jgi:hypothetical protein
MPAVNIDTSFHGVAPELIDPRRWGLTDAGATTASDVYAFAVLAYEVRMGPAASFDNPLNDMGSVIRFSLGDLRFSMITLLRGFIQC